jgi:hypothetical protein
MSWDQFVLKLSPNGVAQDARPAKIHEDDHLPSGALRKRRPSSGLEILHDAVAELSDMGITDSSKGRDRPGPSPAQLRPFQSDVTVIIAGKSLQVLAKHEP